MCFVNLLFTYAWPILQQTVDTWARIDSSYLHTCVYTIYGKDKKKIFPTSSISRSDKLMMPCHAIRHISASVCIVQVDITFRIPLNYKIYFTSRSFS